MQVRWSTKKWLVEKRSSDQFSHHSEAITTILACKSGQYAAVEIILRCGLSRATGQRARRSSASLEPAMRSTSCETTMGSFGTLDKPRTHEQYKSFVSKDCCWLVRNAVLLETHLLERERDRPHNKDLQCASFGNKMEVGRAVSKTLKTLPVPPSNARFRTLLERITLGILCQV